MPAVESRPFPAVRVRAEELGCGIPHGLALLPRNFETAQTFDALELESEALSIRTVWRNGGIDEDRLDGPDKAIPAALEKSFHEWLGPTIFIGTALWTQNKSMMDMALNLATNYVYDFFKGHTGEQQAALSIVVEENDGECTEIKYRGPSGGLDKLPDIIRAAKGIKS
jgi:hypothetical protein